MKSKIIGIIIIVFSIAFFIFSISINNGLDILYMDQMKDYGAATCFLDDGTCIHENPLEWLFVISYIVETLMFVFGIYLIFDKSQINLYENLSKISGDLRKVKEIDDKDKKFEYFIKGLNDDEKKLLRIIKEQEGIWQSTIRIKSGLSKGRLSELLQGLEKKDYIVREKKGKTFKLFIKN